MGGRIEICNGAMLLLASGRPGPEVSHVTINQVLTLSPCASDRIDEPCQRQVDMTAARFCANLHPERREVCLLQNAASREHQRVPTSTVMTFVDPDEHTEAIRASSVRAVVTKPGQYRSELSRVDLHRLWTQRGQVSLPTISYGATGVGRSTIAFFEGDPQSPTIYNGIGLTPDDIILSLSGAEYHRHSPGGYRWGSMSLSSDDLARAAGAILGHDLAVSVASRVIRTPPYLAARLLRLHTAAHQLARTVPDIIQHAEVARAMEEELVRALLGCLAEGAALKADRFHRYRSAVMKRFEEFLEANEDKPLHVTEITEAIGVSGRTLRLHCLERLGISPYRYLYLRRMHLVRRQLRLAEPGMTSVTSVATDHGFWELGRFAVAYRRLFGETPSATLGQPPPR